VRRAVLRKALFRSPPKGANLESGSCVLAGARERRLAARGSRTTVPVRAGCRRPSRSHRRGRELVGDARRCEIGKVQRRSTGIGADVDHDQFFFLGRPLGANEVSWKELEADPSTAAPRMSQPDLLTR